MVDSDLGYFYILHQVEVDLELDHEDLLNASKGRLDTYIEEWFNTRSVISGTERFATEELKKGVFNWKETEKELEEE